MSEEFASTMTNRRVFIQSGALLGAGELLAGYHTRATAQPIRPTHEVVSLQVGPTRAIKTIASCAYSARPGAIIYVDAGTYVGDVAIWTQDNITIRAVGGRVRLLANGAAANGKGIWVVRADNMRVEGFDFEGAKVPDRNGAEGYKWPRNEITLKNNTLVWGGVFLRVASGADAIRAVNNRLVGSGTLESAGAGEYSGNVHVNAGH